VTALKAPLGSLIGAKGVLAIVKEPNQRSTPSRTGTGHCCPWWLV